VQIGYSNYAAADKKFRKRLKAAPGSRIQLPGISPDIKKKLRREKEKQTFAKIWHFSFEC
jgi:hypothetical protein